MRALQIAAVITHRIKNHAAIGAADGMPPRRRLTLERIVLLSADGDLGHMSSITQ